MSPERSATVRSLRAKLARGVNAERLTPETPDRCSTNNGACCQATWSVVTRRLSPGR